MNAPLMKERIAEDSPSLHAGFAVVFYLLTILAGGVVFFIHEWLGFAVVTACYLAATALDYAWFKYDWFKYDWFKYDWFKYDRFKYDWFKPVGRTLSLFAKLVRAVAQVPAPDRRTLTRTSQRS